MYSTYINLPCCKRRDRVRQSAIKVACFLSLIVWLVMIYLGFLGSPLIAEIQLPCMVARGVARVPGTAVAQYQISLECYINDPISLFGSYNMFVTKGSADAYVKGCHVMKYTHVS